MSEVSPEAAQRILVTGSRDWSQVSTVLVALDEATDFGRTPTTIIHGDCPIGADRIAAQWVDAQRNRRGDDAVSAEPHPADWSQGRKAGPRRNAAMVALGADLCLAFISECTSPRCAVSGVHSSHGASGCADLAERAGIPTRRFRPRQPTPPTAEADTSAGGL